MSDKIRSAMSDIPADRYNAVFSPKKLKSICWLEATNGWCRDCPDIGEFINCPSTREFVEGQGHD